jgi:hypothetical protein
LGNLLNMDDDFVKPWMKLDPHVRRATAIIAVLIVEGYAAADFLEYELVNSFCALLGAEERDVMALISYKAPENPLIRKLQRVMRKIEKEGQAKTNNR